MSEGSARLVDETVGSMDNNATTNADPSHELPEEGVQLGILYSPLSRWAAIASSRKADFSSSIANQCFL